MVCVSSLRRIVHSTSLRATGSLIVLCSSAACVVLPLRAAVIPSLKAARSGAEIDSLAASGERVGRGADCAAVVVPAGGPAFAGALGGRGFGNGVPLAERLA